MNKKDVISFFDDCAKNWDSINLQNHNTINKILDIAGICEGKRVLDVACGTGVLFDEYLKRNVQSVTAIDISKEMVLHAKEKHPEINVICGDAETFNFDEEFDCIVIYNAFPHFVYPEKLFKNLSCFLADRGRLTVAHGASREDIIKCHSGKAESISNELIEAEKLAEIMMPFVSVDTVISDDEKYVVSGVKK